MKKTQRKKPLGRKKALVRRIIERRRSKAVLTRSKTERVGKVGGDANARALALLCADMIESKRGFDITILNVSKELQITDYFVICSGRNNKQNQAIAYTFLENYSKLAPYGCSKPNYNSLHGFKEGQWIVVDLGAVVVHIFTEPLRKYYDLEFLWSFVPKVKRSLR